MQASVNSSVSPFVGIWIRPRATMRAILDVDPERHVLVLAVASGVARVLDQASARSMGDLIPAVAILVLAGIGGPIAGVVSLYLGAWLIHLCGTWLGGTGRRGDVRAALAWSSMPGTISALIALVPMLFLSGAEAFTSATPKTDALIASNPAIATLVVVISSVTVLATLVIAVWSIVVTLVSISEALRFSVWRALAAGLLPGVVLVLPIICVGLLLML